MRSVDVPEVMMDGRIGNRTTSATFSWMRCRLLNASSTLLALLACPAMAVAQDIQAHPMRLEEIVVTATRTGLREGEPSAAATVLDRETIESSASISVDDILRTIPGFSLYRRSSSMVTSPDLDPEAQGVTLRGIGPSGSSRALVLVDGVPLIDPFDGQVFWGRISSESIDHVEVVRGSGASLWGNCAMAGVINIITKKPSETGAALKATYGTNGLTDDDVSVTGRFGNWTIGLDGNFFNTHGFPAIAHAERGPVDGDASSRHELLNGRVAYQVGDSASVFMHGQFFDEVHNDGTALRHSGTSAGLFNAGGTLRTDDGDEWQAQLFSNVQTFNIQSSEASDDRTTEHRSLRQKTPFSDGAGSLVWSRKVWTPLLLTAGVDTHWIGGKSRDQIFDDTGVSSEHQRTRGQQFFGGVFFQGIYTPTPQWEIALSGRGDLWQNYDGTQTTVMNDGSVAKTSFPSRTSTAFSPRLGVLYRVAPWLQVRGAAYRGFRAPTLAELYRQSNVEDLKLLPNPHLTAERLNGAEMGFDLPLVENVDFRATGFWSEVENPVTNVGIAFTPDGEATERMRRNEGLARTLGAEAEVLYQILPGVELSGSYLFADATLVRTGPHDKDLEGTALAQIPPHTFTVRGHYSNPRLFTFVLEGRFVDDQFEDQEHNDKQGSFFILNASLMRSLPWWQGEMFLAAENLTNREYVVDHASGVPHIGTPLLGHGGVRFRF